MFTSTMNVAELQREARKDFFELSSKVRIAIERFNRRHCDLINNSQLMFNDTPACLISNSVENRKWRTRRSNTWTTHFRFKNEITGAYMETQCYLYTAVVRTNGTEYIFLDNLNAPIAERFTLHFIERYKERHLKPHQIDTKSMPVPLYFKIKNQDCIIGRYYKTTDIDVEEGKHKKFWIALEGIYVTDYIDGMLTYITFMDKDDLSPLKKQVYEEEIAWDWMLRATDPHRSEEERSKAVYCLAATENLGRIVERFFNRNLEDDDNGEKKKMMAHIREEMNKQEVMIKEAKEFSQKRGKEILQKNKVTGTLNPKNLIDDIDIKEYDIERLRNEQRLNRQT